MRMHVSTISFLQRATVSQNAADSRSQRFLILARQQR
uniref:Uncharacterized protein n=1 Tax=Anguilla anguilla TaxID=7936 RepID=A0A0E9WA11_ANGAN